jgi:hypothetical protein
VFAQERNDRVPAAPAGPDPVHEHEGLARSASIVDESKVRHGC